MPVAKGGKKVADVRAEEAERRYKKEQRANWLRANSALPPRMQKHEQELGAQVQLTVTCTRGVAET